MATVWQEKTLETARSDRDLSQLTEETSEPRGRVLRRNVLLIVALAVVSGLVLGARQLVGSLAGETGPVMSTHRVEPGELLITITEDGNLESANNIDIKCQVAGGSSILWIIEDGKEVKKGEKLVDLDAAALEDQINTQKITYNKARSAVILAEKNYDVAQIAVKEYLEGTFKKALQDADALITVSEENLRTAKNSLEYAEKMFQRGYISSLELESQRFAVKRSQLELDSANTAKEVLEKFTKEKTLEELNSQVETTKAAMESEQAAFQLEQGKLKRLETQASNCTITAPQDGMVVYANERGGRFGQSNASIEEGAAVRDRQTILRLPDLSQIQVKVNVHETKVEELRPNMRARVNIQGREFQGVVTTISNQPESTGWFQGNIKEYATRVRIDGQPEGLKPGMTAEVEILVAHLEDVLTVPVSAVVEQRGQFFCWIRTPDGTVERRPLVLGLSNDQYIEVKDGVAAGDEVIRNPRAVVQEAREQPVEVEEVNVNEKFGEASSSPAPAEQDRAAPPVADGGGPPTGGGGTGPDRGGPPPGGGGRGPGGAARGQFDPMQLDSDGDGKVSKDEAPEQMKSYFDRLDTNGDGFIDAEEIAAMRRRFESRGAGPGGEGQGSRGGGRNLMENDADKDGKVSKEEAPAWMKSFFDRVDGNADGFVDAEEAQQMLRFRPDGAGGGGGGPGQGESAGDAGR